MSYYIVKLHVVNGRETVDAFFLLCEKQTIISSNDCKQHLNFLMIDTGMTISTFRLK